LRGREENIGGLPLLEKHRARAEITGELRSPTFTVTFRKERKGRRRIFRKEIKAFHTKEKRKSESVEPLKKRC